VGGVCGRNAIRFRIFGLFVQSGVKHWARPYAGADAVSDFVGHRLQIERQRFFAALGRRATKKLFTVSGPKRFEQKAGDVVGERLQSEKTGVGAGIEGVGQPWAFEGFVVAVNTSDDGVRGVVQVRHRGKGVQANCVELVAFLHADVGESGKVPIKDRFFERRQASGNDVIGSVTQQRRRLDARSHRARAGDRFLAGRDHQDEDAKLGPVFLVGELSGHAVRTELVVLPPDPLDESAVHAATGAPRAATRDRGEIAPHTVQSPQREGERGVSGRRGSEASRGREVILRHDVNFLRRPGVFVTLDGRQATYL